MSVPIPPPDPYKEAPPLWRRLLVILLLAVWPAGALFLLLGSAAGEDSFLGRGFAALVEAPWWAATGAAMALVSATLFIVRRQPEAGGGHHNRGERTRPGVVVGSRPRDGQRRRHPALGLPSILCRRLSD